MPIYSYACPTCGDFTEMRRMSQAYEDAPCPLCGRLAQRMISLPYFTRVNPVVRLAHERNERSAEQPRVVSQQQWACESAAGPMQPRLHGPGLCNCCVASSFGRR